MQRRGRPPDQAIDRPHTASRTPRSSRTPTAAARQQLHPMMARTNDHTPPAARPTRKNTDGGRPPEPRAPEPRPIHTSGWFSVRSPRSRRQGFVLQCRFSGVKSAHTKTAGQHCHRDCADFTPGVRRCTRRADDVTEGNEPQPPHQPAAPSGDPTTSRTGASSPRETEARRRPGSSSQLLTLTLPALTLTLPALTLTLTLTLTLPLPAFALASLDLDLDSPCL